MSGKASAQSAAEPAAPPPALDPENTIYMDLKYGRVVIKLRPDLAPKHVERVKMLCREGFYDGTPFTPRHRGFHGAGRRSQWAPARAAANTLTCPPNSTRSAHFLRGTVGAARTQDPDSANSQFYIMFAPSPHLDGQYTIWGQVVEGMEFVDMIKRGSGGSGTVSDPDRIIHMRVATDVK